MATRENQGLFIAVILLVLLSVVLAVATFFGFSGLQEAKDQRDSLQTQLTKAQAEKDGYMAQAGVLKAVMGFGGVAINEIPTFQNQLATSGNGDLVTETQSILDQYNSDMAKVAASEGADQTYRKLVDSMKNVVVATHNTNIVLNNSVDEMKLKLETELAAKDKQIVEKDTQLEKAREDLVSEQNRHDLTRTELKNQLDSTVSELTRVSNEKDQLANQLSNAQDTFANDLEARDAQIIVKEAIIESLSETETNVADGKIVSVAPSLRKVIVNLGSNDNLRLKQTFSVYDKEETTFRSGFGKAMVEITKIVGPHLAEARISSISATNPILTGDHLVTSTWDPGYSVPVAIVGRIDLDGDGFSDLQRLISIVEGKGFGNVVAYHDEEGKVVGQIDENTRFFVKGDDPLGDQRDGYARLDSQRERYQTRVISVQEFLNEMGWQSEAKVQRFEENVPSSGFQPRQPGTQVEAGDAFDGN